MHSDHLDVIHRLDSKNYKWRKDPGSALQ